MHSACFHKFVLAYFLDNVEIWSWQDLKFSYVLFFLFVAGVWPSQPDDGNLVNSSDLSWSREVFAVGDELGYIRLFKFPCSQPSVSGLVL